MPSECLIKYAPLVMLTVKLIKAAGCLAQANGIPNLVYGLEIYNSIDKHVVGLIDAEDSRAIAEGCDAIATKKAVVPRNAEIKRLTGPALAHLKGLLGEVDTDRQHYGTRAVPTMTKGKFKLTDTYLCFGRALPRDRRQGQGADHPMGMPSVQEWGVPAAWAGVYRQISGRPDV
jgi:hypothetical protein